MVRQFCTTALQQPVSKPSNAASCPLLFRQKLFPPRLLSLFVVAGLLCGCGGGLSDVPPTVEVKGTVTLDSSPLTDADVVFFDGTQYTAFGKTDGTGRFTLKTRFNSEFIEPGAPAREYRVTVSKMIPPNGMSEEDYQSKKMALRTKRESGEKILESDYVPSKIESIPAKYSVASQTTLKANVKGNQENDFSFPLTSK